MLCPLSCRAVHAVLIGRKPVQSPCGHSFSCMQQCVLVSALAKNSFVAFGLPVFFVVTFAEDVSVAKEDDPLLCATVRASAAAPVIAALPATTKIARADILLRNNALHTLKISCTARDDEPSLLARLGFRRPCVRWFAAPIRDFVDTTPPTPDQTEEARQPSPKHILDIAHARIDAKFTTFFEKVASRFGLNFSSLHTTDQLVAFAHRMFESSSSSEHLPSWDSVQTQLDLAFRTTACEPFSQSHWNWEQQPRALLYAVNAAVPDPRREPVVFSEMLRARRWYAHLDLPLPEFAVPPPHSHWD